jgi:hypothetical protein
VAVGHKDHRRVPVGPAVAFGGLEQPSIDSKPISNLGLWLSRG